MRTEYSCMKRIHACIDKYTFFMGNLNKRIDDLSSGTRDLGSKCMNSSGIPNRPPLLCASKALGEWGIKLEHVAKLTCMLQNSCVDANVTVTGKNASGSREATLNSNDPVLLDWSSSSIDHKRVPSWGLWRCDPWTVAI